MNLYLKRYLFYGIYSLLFRDSKRGGSHWDDKGSSSKSKSYFENDDDEEKAKEEEGHKGGLSSQDRE